MGSLCLFYTLTYDLPYSSPNQSHLLSSLGISPTSPSPQTNLSTFWLILKLSPAYFLRTIQCLVSFCFGSYELFFLYRNISRGLIGPTRQFGTGSIYHSHLYAIIAGVFIPTPAYFWQRRYPNSWTR